MSYKVLSIPPFDRQLKRLAKKYRSLKREFAALLESLEQDPEQGTPLGNNCYKIRLQISSKGKGKSGGARVITNFVVAENSVFLISIYDKSEKENLSDKELDSLLKYVPE
jgi:mRNA-degrading endonuclease RelE of RelBE toxin-antitoxin system